MYAPQSQGGIFNMTEKQVSFHAASSKRKILVVEDELINREILSFMLQDAYDVLLAETGSQAKALLNDHYKTLSLVLLDLNLPDMKGIDILRSIKEEGPAGHSYDGRSECGGGVPEPRSRRLYPEAISQAGNSTCPNKADNRAL